MNPRTAARVICLGLAGFLSGDLIEAKETLRLSNWPRGTQLRQIGYRACSASIAREQHFQRVPHGEHQSVTSARADDLQAERHSVLVQPDGKRQRRMTGQCHGVSQSEPMEIGSCRLT